MNKSETLDKLKGLKLFGMANAYEAIMSLPVHGQISLHQALARITEAEQLHRQQKKTGMYLKLSKLRYNCALEQVECSTARNLSKEQVIDLATFDFLRRNENLLITGSTGCGKSYLACALGRKACEEGYKVIYLSMTRFLEKISQSKLDGTYVKMMDQLAKIDLIILDDFGLQPIDQLARLTLLQILEDRFDKKAMVITSQLPVSKWYDYLNDPTLADAIMDRLSAKANRVDLKGDSLRTKKTNKK